MLTMPLQSPEPLEFREPTSFTGAAHPQRLLISCIYRQPTTMPRIMVRIRGEHVQVNPATKGRLPRPCAAPHRLSHRRVADIFGR
jgi:hypothetical protein